MPDLSAYPNVYNTALVIIHQKGFEIRFDRGRDVWSARKDEWELWADDPIELLGVVGIFEHLSPMKKGEYWWKIDEPNLLARFDPGSR